MAKNISFMNGRDPSIDRFNRPVPQKRKILDSALAEEDEGDNASVFLRLRPTESQRCYEIGHKTIKLCSSEQQNHRADGITTQKHFTFSGIFDDSAMQRDIYISCVESSINNDDNLNILMYGTSGSGKTYTLMGEPDEAGIIPRAIEHIFARYESRISKVPAFKACKGHYTILRDTEIEHESDQRRLYFTENNTSIYSGAKEKILSEHQFIQLEPRNTNVYIWISFFEIYNEVVYDLLEPPSKQPKKRNCLKVISNEGASFIKDLTSVFVVSSMEASTLLTMGLNRRLNGTTNINTNSSRSHCIFVIDVIKHERSCGILHNVYRFCDLAGSERIKKSETTGSRLKEAQNINTSLMVLGRCLDAVYNNQSKKRNDLVPVRESKLTLFLQSSLLGREKLTMVVNVLPTLEFFDENLTVLQYASMAQEIVYENPVKEKFKRSMRFSCFLAQACSSPQFNDTDDIGNSDMSLILDENYRLKEHIEQLEKELVDNEHRVRNQLVDEFDERLRVKDEKWDARWKFMEKCLNDRHAKEVADLNARIERRNDTIEELEEEIETLKRKFGYSLEKDVIDCDAEDSSEESDDVEVCDAEDPKEEPKEESKKVPSEVTSEIVELE